MKKFVKTIAIYSLFISLPMLLTAKETKIRIIPEPVEIISQNGNFILAKGCSIIVDDNSLEYGYVAASLNNYLSLFYDLPSLPVKVGVKPKKGDIILTIKTNSTFNDDNPHIKGRYLLTADKKHIKAQASDFNGLFYAVQSLVQLLPKEYNRGVKIKIPRVSIKDYPRFSWRGLHLDVCRHFMPKEFIFKYLDYMALHKFNVFHFHLTEDQGWRIEIKKYPLLTEIGAFRKETRIGKSDQYDGIRYGGYYTQDEIREIVKYAKERFITVVPEIEMPGHSSAALASYPILGCTGGPYEVQTKWGVFEDVLCAGKESTYSFLEGVIDEVLELFPSEYIHIGGDECPKTKWSNCPHCQAKIRELGLKDEHELQSYLIQRMERYINSKGRKIIGWDEILEGGLAPNAAVMSWRGTAGGIAAANEEHFVVMSPGSHCYLDHYQADPQTQPLAIGGLTTLEKIYGYEPVPEELPQEKSKYIMGAQGNVWTEYILNEKHVEYMVYPRAAALSEVTWSPKEKRDYPRFFGNLGELTKLYDKLGLNYCKIEFP